MQSRNDSWFNGEFACSSFRKILMILVYEELEKFTTKMMPSWNHLIEWWTSLFFISEKNQKSSTKQILILLPKIMQSRNDSLFNGKFVCSSFKKKSIFNKADSYITRAWTQLEKFYSPKWCRVKVILSNGEFVCSSFQRKIIHLQLSRFLCY